MAVAVQHAAGEQPPGKRAGVVTVSVIDDVLLGGVDVVHQEIVAVMGLGFQICQRVDGEIVVGDVVGVRLDGGIRGRDLSGDLGEIPILQNIGTGVQSIVAGRGRRCAGKQYLVIECIIYVHVRSCAVSRSGTLGAGAECKMLIRIVACTLGGYRKRVQSTGGILCRTATDTGKISVCIARLRTGDLHAAKHQTVIGKGIIVAGANTTNRNAAIGIGI